MTPIGFHAPTWQRRLTLCLDFSQQHAYNARVASRSSHSIPEIKTNNWNVQHIYMKFIGSKI